MKLFSKPTEVTLEKIYGVVTEVNYLGTYIEIRDSIFIFSQIASEQGKEVRFTKVIKFY